LYWRERWSALGCRRGWWRLAGLAAFVLAGYFALYAWLRATGEIEFRDHRGTRSEYSYLLIGGGISYSAAGPSGSITKRPAYYIIDKDGCHVMQQPEWWMRVMWPAIALEIFLFQRELLPWTIPRVVAGSVIR